jgi:hypothetical protein
LAKNKKKSKKHNTAKPVTDKHKLMRKYLPDGSFDVDWALMPCDLGGAEYMKNDSVLPFGNDIRICPTYKILKKQYLKSSDDIAVYTEHVKQTKQDIDIQSDKWLKSFSDMDQVLNRYSSASDTPPVIDSIDFREYMNVDSPDFTDMLASANSIINNIEDIDISMLWSTQEYVDITVSNSLSYRIKRVLYDHLNDEVRYCCVEYTKFKISDDITVEIPTLEFIMTVCIGKCVDNQVFIANGRTTNLEPHKKDKFHTAVLKTLRDSAENPDTFKAVRIGIMGIDSMESMCGHIEKHHDHFSRDRYRFIRDQLKLICVDMRRPGVAEIDRQEQIIMTPSIVAAAIIITNSYLKKKQLSKPVATTSVSHETEIILENKPTRKTRKLGNKILITSESRPQAPDKERIIKYHTPEWQCKGHLRRLKSGKIIEIKPHACKRRCVDMTNIKSKLPTQATDYVIAPDKTKIDD